MHLQILKLISDLQPRNPIKTKSKLNIFFLNFYIITQNKSVILESEQSNDLSWPQANERMSTEESEF